MFAGIFRSMISGSEQVKQPSTRIPIALTFDVEDWFTGIPVDRSSVSQCEYRLRAHLDALLELLDEFGVKCTFFWLGELAQEYSDLVRKVKESGHRIACHGWFHDYAFRTDPKILKELTANAKNLLQDISGFEVISFRAPFFSINKSSLWILDMLVELGFRIDSSIFPLRNWRYGIPGFPSSIQSITTRKGSIWLAPISIRKIAGVSFPVSGGAYFRIYPYSLTRSNLRWLEERGQSGVFYLHPWELDPDHPKINFDLRAKLSHYANLSSCGSKFRRLLSEFDFQPLEDVISNLHEPKIKPDNSITIGKSSAVETRRYENSQDLNYFIERRSDAVEESLMSFKTQAQLLLDIGIRDGIILSRILGNLHPKMLIGLDIDSVHFTTSKRQNSIKYLQANCEEIPLSENSVDVVICTSVIKHLWDIRLMLDECARILKPEGLLIIVEVAPFAIKLGLFSNRFKKGTIHEVLNLSDLCDLLDEKGFRILDKNHFMALPFRVPGSKLLEVCLRRIGLGNLMYYQMAVAGIAK